MDQYRAYHYDRRGSTVALTDETAQVTDTYMYSHYGEALEHQGETEQPFQYNGRNGVMTDANGLYYMRARYYNPEIKRFVNRDVVAGAIDDAQTLNRYAYVNGNPISYVDPFGLERIKSTYVAANPTYVASNSSVFMPQVTTKSIIRGLWNDLGDYGERKAKEKDWRISKDEAWFILQLTGGPRGGGVKSGGGAKPWVRMTTKEATAAAKKLGYEPTNHTTKNKQKIFYNKKTKTYISQDIGSADGSPPHKGGVWKMAKSPEALNRKETRMGTYDANLKRIGD